MHSCSGASNALSFKRKSYRLAHDALHLLPTDPGLLARNHIHGPLARSNWLLQLPQLQLSQQPAWRGSQRCEATHGLSPAALPAVARVSVRVRGAATKTLTIAERSAGERLSVASCAAPVASRATSLRRPSNVGPVDTLFADSGSPCSLPAGGEQEDLRLLELTPVQLSLLLWAVAWLAV